MCVSSNRPSTPEIVDTHTGPPSGSGSWEIVIPEGGLNLEHVERRLLIQAMERSGGIISKAARLLGLTYRTMQYRLDKHGIPHNAGTQA
jgi:DNA-binding NtrC family response regulator